MLSVGPGWDWPTMAGLYANIDVYTSQLRKLEAFVTSNPKSTSGHFFLDNLLTLAQQGDAGALVGRVSWQADDTWSFRVIGTGAEDQGLVFTH